MPSKELLDQILDAYYEAEHSSPKDQAQNTSRLNQLLDQAIEGTNYTRTMLIGALINPRIIK